MSAASVQGERGMEGRQGGAIARWVLDGGGVTWLTSVGVVSVILFLFGLWTDTFLLRLITKPFPVLAMALMVFFYRQDTIGRVVCAALISSAIGDIFLELSFPGSFVMGMVAFLIGHLLYAFSFVKQAPAPAVSYFLPYLAWGGCIGWLVWGGLGPLKIPVLVYMSVIVVMMWRATVLVMQRRSARALASTSLWLWAILAGALFYGLSDSLIALNKFHHKMENVRPAISLTYWLGQALIAWTTVKLFEVRGIDLEGAGRDRRVMCPP